MIDVVDSGVRENVRDFVNRKIDETGEFSRGRFRDVDRIHFFNVRR